jgi:hypothetical protein
MPNTTPSDSQADSHAPADALASLAASAASDAASDGASEMDGGVDPRLLEILICPVSRGALTYDRAANELISRSAGLAYPIRNGVPIMLRDEARDLDDPQARGQK